MNIKSKLYKLKDTEKLVTDLSSKPYVSFYVKSWHKDYPAFYIFETLKTKRYLKDDRTCLEDCVEVTREDLLGNINILLHDNSKELVKEILMCDNVDEDVKSKIKLLILI